MRAGSIFAPRGVIDRDSYFSGEFSYMSRLDFTALYM